MNKLLSYLSIGACLASLSGCGSISHADKESRRPVIPLSSPAESLEKVVLAPNAVQAEQNNIIEEIERTARQSRLEESKQKYGMFLPELATLCTELEESHVSLPHAIASRDINENYLVYQMLFDRLYYIIEESFEDERFLPLQSRALDLFIRSHGPRSTEIYSDGHSFATHYVAGMIKNFLHRKGITPQFTEDGRARLQELFEIEVDSYRSQRKSSGEEPYHLLAARIADLEALAVGLGKSVYSELQKELQKDFSSGLQPESLLGQQKGIPVTLNFCLVRINEAGLTDDTTNSTVLPLLYRTLEASFKDLRYQDQFYFVPEQRKFFDMQPYTLQLLRDIHFWNSSQYDLHCTVGKVFAQETPFYLSREGRTELRNLVEDGISLLKAGPYHPCYLTQAEQDESCLADVFRRHHQALTSVARSLPDEAHLTKQLDSYLRESEKQFPALFKTPLAK